MSSRREKSDFFHIASSKLMLSGGLSGQQRSLSNVKWSKEVLWLNTTSSLLQMKTRKFSLGPDLKAASVNAFSHSPWTTLAIKFEETVCISGLLNIHFPICISKERPIFIIIRTIVCITAAMSFPNLLLHAKYWLLPPAGTKSYFSFRGCRMYKLVAFTICFYTFLGMCEEPEWGFSAGRSLQNISL